MTGINITPGVYYHEDMQYELNSTGARIPIFIGATLTENENIIEGYYKAADGKFYKEAAYTTEITPEEGVTYKDKNTGGKYYDYTTQYNEIPDYQVDGKKIIQYKKWADVNKPKSEGGLGVYNKDKPDQNLLLRDIRNFFIESTPTISSEIGYEYIYAIDLGEAKDQTGWINAFKQAKGKRDAHVEVYVGAEKVTGATIEDIMEVANTSIVDASVALNLRYGFFTKQGATDTDLKNTTTGSKKIQYSRIYLIEPLLFGKTIARICVTPNNIEPGYYQYRTVNPGEFIERNPDEQLALQNAGIIFNHDEYTSQNFYPKINLTVGTSFAKSSRPGDAMFHARANADNLLRRVFDECYVQIKANETEANINYLKSRIKSIVDDAVQNDEVKKYNETTGKGTYLSAEESDEDPYTMIVYGQILPINCTVAIDIRTTINTSVIKAIE